MLYITDKWAERRRQINIIYLKIKIYYNADRGNLNVVQDVCNIKFVSRIRKP